MFYELFIEMYIFYLLKKSIQHLEGYVFLPLYGHNISTNRSDRKERVALLQLSNPQLAEEFSIDRLSS